MKKIKCKIGDRLLIKSYIQPKDDYELYDEEKIIKVCTSCSSGWDKFIKEKCNIYSNEYVLHEVIVSSINTDGYHTLYHCINNLSITGMGWQNVKACDIVKILKKNKSLKNRKKDKYAKLGKN